ncbi:hypothetical protein CAPTEDRAFT_225901 [Capitella teleta]|uniref:Uncharacterized protein n=1 Tax=Capitella teleta TaxID=283909 RepID=R7TXP6_CAPTE|nr:hypothetical protein CAPTEDRAFT_225901 [Capitella teleta]|eukprot:ELT98504.1 hypothetical protein CAPTEDRAFT_225901 [Capitella teleta]
MLTLTLRAFSFAIILTSALGDPIRRFKRDNHDHKACIAKRDILFVVDSSENIPEESWTKVLDFVKQTVDMLDIGFDAIRIGFETFGNKAYPQFQLNTYDTKSNIKSAIDRIEWKNELSNTSGAIWYMSEVAFTVENGDRADVPNIAIIIVGGTSSENGQQTISKARTAREKGNSIFAIGVGQQYNHRELFALAGEKGRDETLQTMPTVDGIPAVFNAEDFDSLKNLEAMLIAGISPCGCREENDIAFIVDVSSSMSKYTDHIRDFLVDFINGYITVGQNNINIALITYSNKAKLEFDLAQYYSAAEMTEAIMKQLIPLNGESNTASAFEMLTDQVLRTSRGLRPAKRQIVVLFSDGNSDDIEDTLEEAAEIKERNFEIIVVAVGKWVNHIELAEIASDPDDLNVLVVEESHMLGEVANSLRNLICVAIDHCSSNPCLAGGDCHTLVNNYFCHCRQFYLGQNCEYYCPREADVVFLLDTSSSLGEQGFHYLIGATKKLASNLYSDREEIGIAMETFSDETVLVYDLNDGMARLSQLGALNAAYRGGATDVAKAIRIMNYFFHIFNASPEQRSRVAVLLTDGTSNDGLNTFKSAVESHSSNIHITTAVVNTYGPQGLLELRGVTSDPDEENLLYFNSTTDLLMNIARVKNSMMEAICNRKDECVSNPCVNVKTCVDGIFKYTCECADGYTGLNCERECNGRFDIVFALDVSGSIRRSRFHFLTEWVRSLINELEVHEDRTRVGVVLFSDDATVAIALNEFTHKEDLLQAIDMLPYHGGRTNLAQAIAVIRSMLKPDMESIISEPKLDMQRVKYPRYAVILTDGQPTVDVLQTPTQAIQARLESIQLVVVAIESKFDNEMFRLVGNDPDTSNVFAVEKFSDLPSVMDSVVKATCNSVDECVSNPCRNGATCLDQIDRFFCVCKPGFGGSNCENECTSNIDVALVFDSSGSVEKYYHLALNASRRIVQELSIADGHARVAALNFHEFTNLEFGLDEYLTAEGVMNGIDFIHTGGSSNFLDSLKFLVQELFNGRNGDRSSQDVAIFFTDGTDFTGTSEQIENLVQETEEAGILRIVVALGEHSAPEYLKTIASSESSRGRGIDVQTLQTMGDIDRVANVIAAVVCNIS